jgi:hypothetical protein
MTGACGSASGSDRCGDTSSFSRFVASPNAAIALFRVPGMALEYSDNANQTWNNVIFLDDNYSTWIGTPSHRGQSLFETALILPQAAGQELFRAFQLAGRLK